MNASVSGDRGNLEEGRWSVGVENCCCGRNCSVDIGGRPVLKLSDDDTGKGEAEREGECRQEER